jgi:hypothetical protein
MRQFRCSFAKGRSSPWTGLGIGGAVLLSIGMFLQVHIPVKARPGERRSSSDMIGIPLDHSHVRLNYSVRLVVNATSKYRPF